MRSEKALRPVESSRGGARAGGYHSAYRKVWEGEAERKASFRKAFEESEEKERESGGDSPPKAVPSASRMTLRERQAVLADLQRLMGEPRRLLGLYLPLEAREEETGHWIDSRG